MYQELGRALAPSPHFVSSVMSAGVILAAGSDAQKDEWLTADQRGRSHRDARRGWSPHGGFGPEGVHLTAAADGDGWRLDGAKRHVYFASAADRLLVLAAHRRRTDVLPRRPEPRRASRSPS